MKAPKDFDNSKEYHNKVDRLILLGCLLALLAGVLVEAFQ
jgi:hypothetical protein